MDEDGIVSWAWPFMPNPSFFKHQICGLLSPALTSSVPGPLFSDNFCHQPVGSIRLYTDVVPVGVQIHVSVYSHAVV